ncbi:spore coat protein YutH [Pullulanibacillus camelliae]|uniref:Spore coat protein YutH n=1 Tax=Pullulanibacillus camelliae TaxID=1707096 RepID=A0A8J3DXK1_9BACL|nr:hypothetical protein [Pullulanibacillus camelliae]GGE48550.1 spore coat protein YutH [Pullulanibacillus camelliae]
MTGLQSLLSYYSLSGQFIRQEAERSWFQTAYGTVLIIPHQQVMLSDMDELAGLSDHLIQNGEQGVALPLKNKEGQWLTEVEEQRVVAFLLSTQAPEQKIDRGRALAAFHNKSNAYSFTNLRMPYVQWPNLWIQRTDQLNEWYVEVLQKEEDFTAYEELFLLSYPYFIGRAENAIQYVTDVLRDRQFSDLLTVCHHRLDVELTQLGFSPYWLIDHPARDIAEWIRADILKNGENKAVQETDQFIEDYQQLRPLSQEVYTLIYGRLLFPTDYFDHIDQWKMQERTNSPTLSELKRLLDSSLAQERYLRGFAHRYMADLPVVDWLK